MATRNIVPRADGEGQIGTATKRWLRGEFDSIYSPQIAFPATQNPSADANTLDDYEEGTFTPVLADASTGGNASDTVGAGRYTKTGNIVNIAIRFNNINTTGLTGTNNIYIRALPFAAGGGLTCYDAIYTSNVQIDNAGIRAALDSGASHFLLYDLVDGAAIHSVIINDIADDSGDIQFSITYRV